MRIFVSTHLMIGMRIFCHVEVLQHYLRQGSKPIACVLDCSKAFDLAKFSLIFSRALDSGLPAVVVRVLLHSYKEQEAWVRWGRRCNSETFGFSNSTRQGSCASPALINFSGNKYFLIYNYYIQNYILPYRNRS